MRIPTAITTPLRQTRRMKYTLTSAVTRTAAPPIPKAKAWGARYTASKLAESAPLLDLSQGVPGEAPHASVLASLARVSATHDAAKYGPILGEPSMRASLATELRVLYDLDDTQLKSEDVGITTGCNMAFLVLLMALCPPGESSLLLPLPSYFNHAMSLSLQNVQPRYIPCDPSNAFMPSIASAREILSSDSKVKARGIVLVSPNNPTGAVYTPEALREWYALAQEYGIPLILDETYRDFAGGVPHNLFAEPDWRDTLISIGSFSKGYRIPGHRLGSITASPEVLHHIATICDCMQICPPRPPQLALEPLLPALRADLGESAAALRHRLAIFTDIVASVPGWKVLSSGGFYAYVQFPYDVGSESVGETLATQCGVLTLPGCFFMPPLDDPVWNDIPHAESIKQDKWIRFAIANVSDDTVRALKPRLEKLNDILG